MTGHADEPQGNKPCLLCGGSGVAQINPPVPSDAEAEQNAVSLITAALDHSIRGDGQVLTEQELLAVLGDKPLIQLPQQLATVAAVTAYILRNTAKDDDAARDWWSRIARHLLSEDYES